MKRKLWGRRSNIKMEGPRAVLESVSEESAPSEKFSAERRKKSEIALVLRFVVIGSEKSRSE